MRIFTRWTTLALCLGLVIAGTADAQSADAIAQRLNAKYASLTALRADFTQTMTSEHSDIRDQKTGSLLLRGDDYRLETGDDIYARLGSDVWRYSRSENQVVVSDYMDDEATFSVNDLFFRYEELFTVTGVEAESYRGERHFRMTLRPRVEESLFNEVTLWMRDRDDIVTRMRMLDLNGTIMDFQLEDVELNPRLSENAFAPPAGAEVINLR
ncbi:MAG: LolA family protein [Rhodothermales bacterium]